MRPFRPEAALAAALLVAGCAGAAAGTRPDQSEVEALRAEVTGLRAENQQLARAVESLTIRVDAMTARLAHAPAEGRPAEANLPGARPAEARPAVPPAEPPLVVPQGLAVIRVGPTAPASTSPAAPAAISPAAPVATSTAAPAARAKRAPSVATDVALVEPDAGALSGLSRRSGRELSAEAQAELRAARRKDGVARAHALEDFTTRYPRHPAADDALLDAAVAYADAGLEDAACTLARRIADEYPAGDALADALWRLSACESRGGAAEAERRLLTRLVTEFPSTAAARRAGERLAVITGRPAVEPTAADPARSGP